MAGIQVHMPNDPISFLLECLFKLELEGHRAEDGFPMNLFTPNILSDGSQVLADGTRLMPDGTAVLHDGSKMMTDGTRVLADGTVLPPGAALGRPFMDASLRQALRASAVNVASDWC